ncbi:PTS sugar transporter subunit IIB [Mollicutes bacterium LVI A0039]|nr:PTS sugar transporter subunit IIB [Mollicutes bacterium LVI A0039]
MTIYLFCSAGMSTSLLVTKMQKEATARGLDYHIEAFPESTVGTNGEKADVLLLGPQIRFKEAAIKKQYPDKPVAAIDMRAYGMVDGAAVLDTAIKMYEESK